MTATAMDDTGRRPANLRQHELIGLKVEVVGSPSRYHMALQGVVVDETRETLVVRRPSGARAIVPKRANRFAFTLPEGPVTIEGDSLRFRPEDRVKRGREA